MQIIQGASLLDLQVHDDERGALLVLEESMFPFVPRRIFYMLIPNAHTVRAEHSGTAEQLIICASGAVSIDMDNGEEQASLRLAERDQALWVRPGVWLRLRDCEPGTVLLVAASLPYAETRHFDRPQPLYKSAT